MKRDGTFSIQVLGDKDIVIHQSDSASYERLYEDDTVSDLAKYALTGECSDLLLATAGLPTTPKPKSVNELRPNGGKGRPTSNNPSKTDFASLVTQMMSQKLSIVEEQANDSNANAAADMRENNSLSEDNSKKESNSFILTAEKTEEISGLV